MRARQWVHTCVVYVCLFIEWKLFIFGTFDSTRNDESMLAKLNTVHTGHFRFMLRIHWEINYAHIYCAHNQIAIKRLDNRNKNKRMPFFCSTHLTKNLYLCCRTEVLVKIDLNLKLLKFSWMMTGKIIYTGLLERRIEIEIALFYDTISAMKDGNLS